MLRAPRRGRKPLRLVPVPWPDDHPVWLELDRELPADHLARRIRALVEQVDLTELLASFAGVGSRVYPPDRLLAFVLFEVRRKHLSPATWFLDSQESGPGRWLLRGLRPSRCVFYRFGHHLPQELLDTLNQQVLRWAQDEGHSRAACASLDGTLHAAAGSRHQLLNADALERRTQQLDAVLAQEADPGPDAAVPSAGPAPTPAAVGDPDPDSPAGGGADAAPASAVDAPLPSAPAGGGDDDGAPPAAADPAAATAAGAAAGAATPRPGWMARSRDGRRRQRRRYEQARQTLQARLADHDRKQRRQRKVKRRAADQVKICPGEPEAALGRDKTKVFRPLYNTQIVQDLESPFVLGYGVYATVTDAGLLPPMLKRTRELTGHGLEDLLVDSMYARLLDVRCCREQEVRLYAPLAVSSATPEPPGPDGPIGKEAFAWLEAEHSYRCPQGHRLPLERRGQEGRRDGEQVVVEQYRCAPGHCQGCPLASRCTTRPEKGRTVKRLEGQEWLDEVGQRTQSPEGQRLYKKRNETVELRHADFRAHRGLSRFPSYGLGRARGLIGLLVLAHNGLALLDARDAKKAKIAEAKSPP
jgi:hypothetical protein